MELNGILRAPALSNKRASTFGMRAARQPGSILAVLGCESHSAQGKRDLPLVRASWLGGPGCFQEWSKNGGVHAGLECGIIGERVGNMDMVSLGPRIEGAHSPDERVYVESVAKSWKYLGAILAELARG